MKEKFEELMAGFWLSYAPGVLCLGANAICLYWSLDSDSSVWMLLVNVVGCAWSVKTIVTTFKFIRRRALMSEAFETVTREAGPKVLAIYWREHNKHGLKDNERLSPGQLLAVHDEIAAIMDLANARYKSLVEQSMTGKP